MWYQRGTKKLKLLHGTGLTVSYRLSVCVLHSVFYSFINCISVTFWSSLAPVLTSSGANYWHKELSSITERFKENLLLLLLQTGGWGQLWRTKQGIQNLSNKGYYDDTCSLLRLLLLHWVVFCFFSCPSSRYLWLCILARITHTIIRPSVQCFSKRIPKSIQLFCMKYKPYLVGN